jgi:hypothetical protein
VLTNLSAKPTLLSIMATALLAGNNDNCSIINIHTRIHGDWCERCCQQEQQSQERWGSDVLTVV